MASIARLSWCVTVGDPQLDAAVTRLRATLHRAGLTDTGDWSGSGDRAGSDDVDAVLVWADTPLPADVRERLADLMDMNPDSRSTGGRRPGVVLAGPTLERADPEGGLAEAAGVMIEGASGVHDVRVRPGAESTALAGRLLDHDHAGLAHLGEHTHIHDRVMSVEKVSDDVRVLLTAQLGLDTHPVATWRPGTRALTWTLGSRAEAVTSRSAVRTLVLVLREMLRESIGLLESAPVRVGLLGYGAIGHEHSRAVRHTQGLELAAVADTSAARLAAALEHAPGVRTYADAAELLADDGVDMLVVSTPPNTHAEWALRALRSGRHVVVEKPFAICTQEADEILSVAAAGDLYAAVYQNRRFDPDHLAVKRAVRSGAIGEVFHLETFVGGYGHPCNLWHSDAAVSGGAFYDWGAHVLDQILDLLDEPVESVTATEHKRVWLDVTNADHSRVSLHFASGAEATFVYSDLAAALKPRWYVLGTAGALVGHWRTERVIARSDIGTLAEDVLAPADSPPLLDLHAPDGSVTRLATPPAPPYPFHAELADAVQLGLATSVTGEQSRRVLAVMEAARESARHGGRAVTPR